MCANLVLRAGTYPHGLTFEPKCVQEDSIERYFGQVKCIKNNPTSTTVANAVQAAQLIHRRQQKNTLEAGHHFQQDGFHLC